MAVFEANVWAGYFNNGASFGGTDLRPATLDDNDGGDDEFTVGETIDITVGGTPVAETYAGTIVIDGETFVAVELDTAPGFYNIYGQVDDPAAFAASSFPPTIDPTSFNTDPFMVCFAAGTLIATPDGETTVETLSIGDLLLTQDGRTVPVKWVGRQTVHKLFTPAERFLPVRVAAGALGDGLPHTDLVLTADHALIFDGLAITTGSLVNGTTIAYTPIESLPERVTYYHIETEAHDVILANGAAAETYVDYIQRSAFDNYQEYVDLYGEDKVIAEMPLPRVSAARLVPQSIRARLATSDAA